MSNNPVKEDTAVAFRIALLAILAVSGLAWAGQGPGERLQHTNLLVFHDRTGAVKPIGSKSDWELRRLEILQDMQDVMGPLPGTNKLCALDVKVDQEVDCGTYVRRHLSYCSEPGCRVPAYLLIPKEALIGKTNLLAMLTLHPTDLEFGNRVLVEQLRPNYRAYARDLAERGFVVLAPAYPLMADYQPDLKSLGYTSGTMKAVWDNKRALDLLESLPFVRKGALGVLGHSLGGHNAIFTAVFDQRLKVVVSSCGFDSFVDYKNGDITGWTSQRYMPRLLEYRNRVAETPFDFYELIGALAPRPCFVNAPLHDSNFSASSVDRIMKAATAIYSLYGVPQNLAVVHPDSAHDFPPEARDAAYAFLERALRPD